MKSAGRNYVRRPRPTELLPSLRLDLRSVAKANCLDKPCRFSRKRPVDPPPKRIPDRQSCPPPVPSPTDHRPFRNLQTRSCAVQIPRPLHQPAKLSRNAHRVSWHQPRQVLKSKTDPLSLPNRGRTTPLCCRRNYRNKSSLPRDCLNWPVLHRPQVRTHRPSSENR